jgi:hypothetical protein
MDERLLDAEIRAGIEGKKTGMACPEGFLCVEKGCGIVCSVKDIGLTKYVVCEDGNSPLCKFKLAFGSTNFCRCAMRVHIARELGR